MSSTPPTVKSRPESSTRIYRRLLTYVTPHWRAFVAATVALAMVAGTEATFAYFIKPMMDGTFVERDPFIIKMTPVVLVVIFLVRGTASFVAGYWMAWVGRKVIKVFRSEMFQQLLCLPVSFFDATPSGTILSKLIYDVEQVARATTDVITIMVRDSISVVALIGLMFYHDWKLALILMIGTPVVAAVINNINRRFRRYSKRIQSSMGEVTQIAEEAVEGQRVVKTFGGQEYETERFEQANEKNRRLNLKLQITSVASVPVVEFVAAFSAAGVIYVALLQIERSEMSVGTFMSFIAAMMMMLSPMKRLTKIAANLQRGIAAAESIFKFIDTPAEKDDGKVNITRCNGHVSYDNVHFSYDSSKEDVLKGINFTVEPGQNIAFVGRSGSGKSTLVNLLARFYDVSEGRILLDGRNICDFPLQSLRDQIALVTQHITLFNDTIANNIAYGRLEGASRDDIVQAATAAHAMEFINELPDGLDTMVGENGVLLSGGQRQRLAIARALLKDAPVLILDEATSALDTQSERHIQAALEELMKNRTTLVIAHRLSTIERADQILVMEKGEIVEQGRHRQLLEQEGRYAALYRMQFND